MEDLVDLFPLVGSLLAGAAIAGVWLRSTHRTRVLRTLARLNLSEPQERRSTSLLLSDIEDHFDSAKPRVAAMEVHSPLLLERRLSEGLESLAGSIEDRLQVACSETLAADMRSTLSDFASEVRMKSVAEKEEELERLRQRVAELEKKETSTAPLIADAQTRQRNRELRRRLTRTRVKSRVASGDAIIGLGVSAEAAAKGSVWMLEYIRRTRGDRERGVGFRVYVEIKSFKAGGTAGIVKAAVSNAEFSCDLEVFGVGSEGRVPSVGAFMKPGNLSFDALSQIFEGTEKLRAFIDGDSHELDLAPEPIHGRPHDCRQALRAIQKGETLNSYLERLDDGATSAAILMYHRCELVDPDAPPSDKSKKKASTFLASAVDCG